MLISIRAAIAAIIQEARPDMNAYGTVPGVPQVPAVVVAPAANPTAVFDVAMGVTAGRWFLDIYVLMPYTEQDSGQTALDALLDPLEPDSVVSALRTNYTLNGTATDSNVTGIKNYGGTFESASIQHIGAVITLEVLPC